MQNILSSSIFAAVALRGRKVLGGCAGHLFYRRPTYDADDNMPSWNDKSIVQL